MRAVVCLLLAAGPAFAGDKPEPTDEKVLFEGPAPGEVMIVRPKADAAQTIPGTILFVAKDAIYFRVKSGAVEVYEFPRFTLKFASATVDGKKRVWQWDEAKKEVAGYTAPPRIPVVPPAGAIKSESKYLFFALERLQQRIDQAVAAADPQLMKLLTDRAEIVKEHAEKEKIDPRVVKLYADLPEYIAAQQAIDKERREFLDKHMEKIELNAIKDKEAALRSEMEKTKGLGEYFRGAFPRVHIGIGRGWWGRPYAYGSVSYDFGGAMAGVATMIRAEQQYELQTLRIRFAKELLDKEKQKTLTDMGDRQKKMKDARLKQIADVGAEAFSLPKSKDSLETRDLASDLQAKGDFRSLLDVLESRASTERGRDDQANPYTLLDSAHTASQIKERTKAEQAEKLFKLAVQAVDAVKFIPAGRVYDPDRADVMRTAAGLACMAAMLDSPDDSWRGAYSAKAAYAVRLLDRAKGYNLDQGGQVREQMTVALALAGRHDEAVRLAGEIKGTRKGSTAFLVSFARLLAINDDHKAALDALQDAINLGYQDVAFFKSNPDFIALRRDSTRYNTFTGPQYSVFWVLPKTIGKNVTKSRFEIENKSPFAVTEVRLTLHVEISGRQRPLTFTKTVSQLDKGDKINWEDVFSEAPSTVRIIKMTIDSDQGKHVIENLRSRSHLK